MGDVDVHRVKLDGDRLGACVKRCLEAFPPRWPHCTHTDTQALAQIFSYLQIDMLGSHSRNYTAPTKIKASAYAALACVAVRFVCVFSTVAGRFLAQFCTLATSSARELLCGSVAFSTWTSLVSSLHQAGQLSSVHGELHTARARRARLEHWLMVGLTIATQCGSCLQNVKISNFNRSVL